MVKSSVSTSSTSSQAIGVDTVAAGDAADGVGGRDRVVAGVLVVVDEDLRPGRGPSATTRSSTCAGVAPLDLAGEGERRPADLGKPQRGSMRT